MIVAVGSSLLRIADGSPLLVLGDRRVGRTHLIVALGFGPKAFIYLKYLMLYCRLSKLLDIKR